jgi:predicted DNA-binding transcriptional regulator YafY
VVEAEQVQDGGVQVVDTDAVLRGSQAHLVGLAAECAALPVVDGNRRDGHSPGALADFALEDPSRLAMKRTRSDAERRTRQSVRLARVLRLLQLIQQRRSWNVKMLARELEFSERTVFRDLQVLQLAGVPWYFDQQAQCYRVQPDFRFPVLNLTEAEVLGQAVATTLAEASGLNIGAGARPTTEKLASSSNDAVQRILADASHLVSVLDLKLADHSGQQERIRSVQWALLQRKQLVGRYQSPYEARAVALRLHPYRLCLVKQAWYLIGRAADRDAPHTYRIARFRSLRMTDLEAEVPADFDLRGYFGNAWGVYRGAESYKVEVAFTREAAALVAETTWHHTQKVRRQKDGTATITFQVDGLDEILWWVLGWSGRVRVINPPELREKVVAQLRAALQMNQS